MLYLEYLFSLNSVLSIDKVVSITLYHWESSISHFLFTEKKLTEYCQRGYCSSSVIYITNDWYNLNRLQKPSLFWIPLSLLKVVSKIMALWKALWNGTMESNLGIQRPGKLWAKTATNCLSLDWSHSLSSSVKLGNVLNDSG